MACSRMPKCSVRPYSLPGNILVWWSLGMKDGSPFIVVRLLSARSAEPPHSSGSTGPIALSTSPEALRVAMPLASGGKLGSALSQPVGQLALSQPVEQFLAARRWPWPMPRSGSSHSACAAWPRSITPRACATRSAGLGEGDGRVEAEDLLGLRDLLGAQGRAVRRAGVLLVRGGPADDRAQLDHRRPAGLVPGRDQRVVQRLRRPRCSRRPADPVDVLDVPPVGLVPRRDVLGLGDLACRPRSRCGCRRRSGSGCRAPGGRPARRPRA